MKANKVPEKLYGCYKGNGNFFIDYRSFPNDESIEYTRTDAFIEKAKEFIYSALNDGIMGTANIGDFMRLFKKYIKGE